MVFDQRLRTAERWRVVAFAGLGYLYIAALVAVLLATGVLLIRSRDLGRLALFPAGLLVLVLRALWVRLPPPDGRELTRADAPRLFELIDEIRLASAAAGCHAVLATADVNAAVAELPRLVLFGTRRYLMIGLPLAEALSEGGLRAVLAHEFAHLSQRHGRLRLWAFRLRTTWSALAFHAQWTRNWAAFLFVPFFRWYAPRFEALVERVSRLDEVESDQLAANIAGAEAIAEALICLDLCRWFMQREVWPQVFAQSFDRDTPPPDAVQQVLKAVPDYLRHPQAVRWTQALLLERAVEEDSHPSLADRLRAVRLPATCHDAPRLVESLRERFVAGSTARLLGGEEAVDRLTQELGQLWAESVRPLWRQLRGVAKVWRESDWSGSGPSAPDSESVMWARARWASVCEPPEVAIPLLRQVLQCEPDHSEARLLLGQLLLAQIDPADQEAGRQLLEHAIGEESSFALEASAALRRHYARQGRTGAMQRCKVRETELQAAFLRSLRERGTLRYGDSLRTYPIPATLAGYVRDSLRAQRDVERAYLIQKRTKHLSATPVVIVAFEIGVPWYRPAFGQVEARVCEEVAEAVVLPEGLDCVVIPVHRRSRLARRLRRLPGAEFYRREGSVPREPVGLAARQWTRPSLIARLFTRPVRFGLLILLLAVIIIAILG